MRRLVVVDVQLFVSVQTELVVVVAENDTMATTAATTLITASNK